MTVVPVHHYERVSLTPSLWVCTLCWWEPMSIEQLWHQCHTAGR